MEKITKPATDITITITYMNVDKLIIGSDAVDTIPSEFDAVPVD